MFNLVRAALVGAVFLPMAFGDNMFAGCYTTVPRVSVAPATGGTTRESSDLCNVSNESTSLMSGSGKLSLLSASVLQ